MKGATYKTHRQCMTVTTCFHDRLGAGDSTFVSKSELQSASELASDKALANIVSGIGLAENEQPAH